MPDTTTDDFTETATPDVLVARRGSLARILLNLSLIHI